MTDFDRTQDPRRQSELRAAAELLVLRRTVDYFLPGRCNRAAGWMPLLRSWNVHCGERRTCSSIAKPTDAEWGREEDDLRISTVRSGAHGEERVGSSWLVRSNRRECCEISLVSKNFG